MRQRLFKNKQAKAAFITLDTKKCVACWECIDICPQNVIGRINLPWHKHAKLSNQDACIGCMKCVKVCKAKAISQICE